MLVAYVSDYNCMNSICDYATAEKILLLVDQERLEENHKFLKETAKVTTGKTQL